MSSDFVIVNRTERPSLFTPVARGSALNFRPAIVSDLPFIDRLQKMHSHMVGWMPGKQLEQKIEAGQVLVAEEVTGHSSRVTLDGLPGAECPASDKRQVTNDIRLGYCISQDQYMGRDDVG